MGESERATRYKVLNISRIVTVNEGSVNRG